MRKALVKRGGQIIEVDVDDNHVNQLHKAQKGEQFNYPLNDMGEEIRYRKEFDRRGKRITKEKLVTPPNEEEGEKGSTRYVKRVLDDSGQGRMISRPSGIDYFINPFRANFIGEPRDGSYIDYEINPNFNQQPRMFQMGGAPQEQMAQQQMPPQQEGQAQGSEQDQIMRLIQAYAEAMGISPEEIIQELQQMNPQEQKQAIDQMAQELQGGQQAQAPEQQMSPEQMMQMGGANNIYTPDTGTEQYAPDPSWYDGGNRVAAPGNVVSWPSYPEGGRPSNIPLYNSVPIEEQIIRRDPRKTGITTFNRYPSVPEREYDDSSYNYEDDYNPVRRVPFFENIADRVGDGFDNVGDFFKKLKRRGGRRGGRMRGNGLLNCKPGTKCFKFQEGGDLQNDSPLDKLTAEHKNQNFANLVQEFGQKNHRIAFSKDLANDFKKFQAGGYITDADGSQQYSLGHNFNFNNAYRLQQEANNRDKNANTGEAFWKLFGTAMNSAQKLKSGMSGIGGGGTKVPASKPASTPVASATPTQTPTPAATTPAAPAPAAGAAPAATPAASGNPLGALSSILGGGGGGAASALGGMDLSALAGFLRYGGSLPTADDGGILGKILPAAAGIAGTMFAGPIGGMAAKTAVSGITGGGKGASGGGGGGFDPSALISMFAKYGGNLPRYQSNVTTGQVSIFDKIRPDFVPHDPNFVPWANNNTISSFKPSEHVYDFKGPSNQPDFQLIGKGLKEGDPDYEKIELPPDQPDNSLEAWRKQMKDNSAVTEDGKNWDPLKFNKEDIEKYNLDPTQNNITQKKEKLGFPGFMQATKGMGIATAGFLESWGNRDKAIKAQNKADMALLSDHSSKANTPDMLDLGDYGTNVFMPKGDFRPNSNVPMGYNASEFGKYGMQVAKVGTQVQNPYMSNPYSHPEAILYGKPDPKVSNTLKPVKREDANLEAEIGEVAVTPAGPDGISKYFNIGGKNHYDGGTPLSLPENTFIYSKTRSMIIKDPKILKELTGSTKPATPADLAKKFDFSDYIAILQNEKSDPVERKTAQMMIENMMYKLGQIAIIQEAKKGFPSGIPLIAVPYLEKAGIDPQMLLPQTEQPEIDPRMQQQMMQQPQQQMDPRMMQEQMEPMPEEMMMPPMARYGGSNIMGSPVLPRYQNAGPVSNFPAPIMPTLESEQPNFAQQVLGPLFNYLPEEDRVEDMPPPENMVNSLELARENARKALGMDIKYPFLNPSPIQIAAEAPVKGFKNMDDLRQFYKDGDKLDVNLRPIYNAYSGAIQGIAKLKKALISGAVPFDVYEKEKEALVARIDGIKTQLSKTNQGIDNTKSSSWNPWSTANKIQDLEDILVEEKNGLNVKATSLKKFRELQNNLSTLEDEKKLLMIKRNNPNIDDLDIMELDRKIKDLDKALYIENIKVKDFGKRLIDRNASNVPVNDDWINESLGDALLEDDLKNKGKRINPLVGDGSWKKYYTYKEYVKQHGLIGKPSVNGSTDTPTNGSTNTSTDSQMVADSIAKSTPYVEVPVEAPSQPVQSRPAKTQSGKPAVSRPTTSKSQTKKIVTFGPNDQGDIKIIQQP